MAYLTSALLLSLILSIAYSVEYNYHSGPRNISLDQPFNGTFGPINLYTVANLVVEYNTNITICIVAAEFGLPAYTLYSDEVCLYYYQWNATKETTSTVQLPLLKMDYTIGIYVIDPTTIANSKTNATISITVTGDECPEYQIFDNKTLACLNFTELKGWNDTLSVTFKASETKIFVWDNPINVGNIEFSYTPLGSLTEENLFLIARFNGPASQVYNDGLDTNGKLVLATPKPGRWVFSLRATAEGKVIVELSGKVCAAGLAGKDCTIHVQDATNILNLTVTSTVQYFKVAVNKTTNVTQYASFLASVTTTNGSFIPYLYATRGQIPDEKTADIKNCNRGWCNEVRSVQYNATQDEVWYVAIVSSASANSNITAAVWFYQHCIPACELDSHGQCLDSGKCECEIDYDGVNCNHSRGLGPQYIVLIIIASLVVASAVIGFVAWAYMRQKRGAYEPLG